MKYVIFILISIIIIGCGDTGTSPNVVTKDAKDMTYSEYMDFCVETIRSDNLDYLPLCNDFDIMANAPYVDYSFIEREAIPRYEEMNLPSGVKFYYSGSGFIKPGCISNPAEFCQWAYAVIIQK